MTANPTPDGAAQRDFDLIDLFHEIVSRWKVILACVVLFTAVGAIAVSQMDRTYRYVTTIELGRVASIDASGGVTTGFVESSASAASRLESAYIPAVTGESESDARSLISANSNDNIEGLVTLESVASPNAASNATLLHEEVARRLQQDHFRRIEAQRSTIQLDLDRLQESILDIANEIADLRAEEDAISSSLNTALEDLANIGSENASSNSLMTGPANQTNILLERQSLLANFDRSRQAVVERRRDLIERQRGLRQEASVRSLALTNVRDTEAIALAIRSVDPAGPGRGLILAVSVLTGAVVGTAIAILMFLFRAIARRRAAERI